MNHTWQRQARVAKSYVGLLKSSVNMRGPWLEGGPSSKMAMARRPLVLHEPWSTKLVGCTIVLAAETCASHGIPDRCDDDFIFTDRL